jgi:hypothetical protein
MAKRAADVLVDVPAEASEQKWVISGERRGLAAGKIRLPRSTKPLTFTV